MALGEEQQQVGEKGAASALWTIDAEDSIREGIGRAQFHMTLVGTCHVKPTQPIK